MYKRKFTLGYEDFQKAEMSEKLTFIEQKIKYPSNRDILLDEIKAMSSGSFPKRDETLDFDQTVFCLTNMTRCFFSDSKPPYNHTFSDRNLCRATAELVSYLTLMPNPKDEISTVSKEGYFNISNYQLYLSIMDKIILEADRSLPQEDKKGKFAEFAVCISEMCKELGFSAGLPYSGKSVKISKKTGIHGHSVLLLPDNPKNAVAIINDCGSHTHYTDDVQTLFFEFDQKDTPNRYPKTNSAETYINNFYGTDGLYAEHYQALIDCKERYPNWVRTPS